MSITLVTNRASLNPNDYIDWPSTGSGGVAFATTSAMGIANIVITQDTPCDGLIFSTSGNPFDGVTNLMGSICGAGPNSNFSITFPTGVSVKSAGTAFAPAGSSAYTAQMVCYDAAAVALGTVTNAATGVGGADTAIFIGALSTDFDIHKVTFSMLDPQASQIYTNRFSFWIAGGAGGDPHFVGFNGAHYDVMGEHGKCYNLLSDYNIQVNSLFNTCEWYPDNTHMAAVGIKIGTKETGIHKVFYGIGREPRFDSKPIVVNKWYRFPSGILDQDGRMVKATVIWDGDKLLIDSGEYRIEVGRVWEMNEWMVDCKFSVTRLGILADGVLPHGLIGCTANRPGYPGYYGNQGEGIVEGEYKHYEVESIYSDSFRYNRFNKPAERKPIFGCYQYATRKEPTKVV